MSTVREALERIKLRLGPAKELGALGREIVADADAALSALAPTVEGTGVRKCRGCGHTPCIDTSPGEQDPDYGFGATPPPQPEPAAPSGDPRRWALCQHDNLATECRECNAPPPEAATVPYELTHGTFACPRCGRDTPHAHDDRHQSPTVYDPADDIPDCAKGAAQHGPTEYCRYCVDVIALREQLETTDAALAAANAELATTKRALPQMQEAAKDLTAKLEEAERESERWRELARVQKQRADAAEAKAAEAERKAKGYADQIAACRATQYRESLERAELRIAELERLLSVERQHVAALQEGRDNAERRIAEAVARIKRTAMWDLRAGVMLELIAILSPASSRDTRAGGERDNG